MEHPGRSVWFELYMVIPLNSQYNLNNVEGAITC